MFELGWTFGDLKRVIWTFGEGAAAYAFAAAVGWVPGDPWDWKAVLVGAIAAGIAALKNGLLSPRSRIK